MTFYSWILLVVAVSSSWLLVNRWVFRDFMSPFNLLLPAWIFPLLLKTLHLSSKEQPWNSKTVLLIAWVTFALAAVSLTFGLLINPRTSPRQVELFEGAKSIARQNLFQGLTLFSFFVGIVSYFYFEFVTNPIGIPMLSYLRNPNIDRDPLWQWGKDIRLWPLPALALVNVPVLYFISLCDRNRLKRVFYLCLALIYPLAAIAKMSRMDTLTAAVSRVLVRYYFKKYQPEGDSGAANRPSFLKRSAYRAVVVLVVAGAIVASSTAFSLIRGNRTMGALAGKLGITLDLQEPTRSVVVEAYGYLALPFENLSNFLNDYPGGWHPGVGVLRPAYSVLQLGTIPRAELDDINFPPSSFAHQHRAVHCRGVRGVRMVRGRSRTHYLRRPRKPHLPPVSGTTNICVHHGLRCGSFRLALDGHERRIHGCSILFLPHLPDVPFHAVPRPQKRPPAGTPKTWDSLNSPSSRWF